MGLNAEVELNCITSFHERIIPMTNTLPTDELPYIVETIKDGWLCSLQSAATVVREPLLQGLRNTEPHMTVWPSSHRCSPINCLFQGRRYLQVL